MSQVAVSQFEVSDCDGKFFMLIEWIDDQNDYLEIDVTDCSNVWKCKGIYY